MTMEPDGPAYPDPDSRTVLEPGCDRCPALVEARTCISWGTGQPDAPIMVIGEAPGAGDPAAERWKGGNWTGMAFTSRHSGRRIRAMFERLGYGRDELFITNAVKCFPSDGRGGNREPTDTERRRCARHLRTELDLVAPDVVVPAGKHATAALLSDAGYEHDRFIDVVLTTIPLPRSDAVAIPILHPSYQEVWIARLGYDYEDYLSDLGKRIAAAIE